MIIWVSSIEEVLLPVDQLLLANLTGPSVSYNSRVNLNVIVEKMRLLPYCILSSIRSSLPPFRLVCF